MDRKKDLLAFVHMEKSAGTSFIHILRRNFLFRYLDVRPFWPESDGVFTARDLRASKRLLPDLRCIAGHAVKPYADLSSAHECVLYVTVLRNPVRRYISQYQHWRERMRRKVEFKEFLENRLGKEFPNL